MGNAISTANKSKTSPPTPIFSDTDDDSDNYNYTKQGTDSDDETVESYNITDNVIETDDYNSINSLESFDSHSLNSDIGSNIFKFIDDTIRYIPTLTCNHPLYISSNILLMISAFGQNIDHSNIHFFTTKKYKIK